MKALSTYLSTVVSSYVVELDPDEVDDFMKDNPRAKLSAQLTSNVDITLTAYGNSPDGDYYDNGIPPITKIDVGFYAIPTSSSDFEGYMTSVDNGSFV